MKAQEKLEKLKLILWEMESLLLAFSGGVDSTFLLKVAKDILGEKLLAVTASSPIFPRREYLKAKELAESLGARFTSIFTDELPLPEFARNPTDRCYWCKKELSKKLWEIARQERMKWVADGSNFDDLGDFRPGRKAAKEMEVRSPLCEAEIGKEEVRALSRNQGLPTWDKPSFACLASRIPYGIPITKEILESINRAEEFLLSLGLNQVRVRHHDKLARIEVEPEDMPKAFQWKEKIVSELKSLGYVYIVLDLEGYRSGSLNLPLQKQKFKIY